MTTLFWRFFAKLLTIPFVRNSLIAFAKRTPYQHINSADGQKVYMGRWWVLNPYNNETRQSKYPWLPFSIRIHHIKQPDLDRHLHDHPWNARTIILKGWYIEQRLIKQSTKGIDTERVVRYAGETAKLKHGEYHRIDEVSPGGVFTLFITGRYVGSWGFLVSDKKIPWREYQQQQLNNEVKDL